MSGYDLADIEAKAGYTAAREFEAAAEQDKPLLVAWIEDLPKLSDDELYDVAVSAIDKASLSDVWTPDKAGLLCRAYSVMHEARRRATEAGHHERCADTVYERALHDVMRSLRVEPFREAVCTCDNNDETEDESK